MIFDYLKKLQNPPFVDNTYKRLLLKRYEINLLFYLSEREAPAR